MSAVERNTSVSDPSRFAPAQPLRASLATPASGPAVTRLMLASILALALVLGLALSVSSAYAAPRVVVDEFDGADTTAGAFAGVDRIAFDQDSGPLYVLDAGKQALDKFDASGAASNFSGPGESSVGLGALGGDPDVAVDNSGTASDGNVYVVAAGESRLYGFASTGQALGGFPVDLPAGGDYCGVGVDPQGGIWVSDYNLGLRKYTAAGSADGVLGFADKRCHLTFDTLGSLYWAVYNGAVEKYNPDGMGAFVADSETPTIDSGSNRSVATNPANNHVFAVQADQVVEYDADGALVASFGAGTLTDAKGAAVNGATGAVYVSDASANKVFVFEEVEPSAPGIDNQRAGTVSGSDAIVKALIDPKLGGDTTYHVEYGPTTSYGSTTSESASIGDASAKAVQAHLAGLEPGTTYHFRFVATNELGTTEGADQTFTTFSLEGGSDSCPNAAVRTGLAAFLPDCRGYEKVSPDDKADTDVGHPTDMTAGFVSPDGNAAVFASFGAFAGTVSSGIPNAYLATRVDGAWSTRSLQLPINTNPTSAGSSVAVAATPDLSKQMVMTNVALTPGAVDGHNQRTNIYIQDLTTNTLRFVATTPLFGIGAMQGLTKASGGVTDDGKRWVFGTNGVPLPGTTPTSYGVPGSPYSPQNVYLWDDGVLKLVNVSREGEALDGKLATPQYDARGPDQLHNVSEDAEYIYWEVSTGGIEGQQYLRKGDETIAVSTRESDGELGRATFWRATADGKRAYYVANEQLTNDASTDRDLYEFDAETEELRVLTPQAGTAMGVLAIGGPADDPYLYFVDTGVLAPGATAGEYNIYVLHDDEIRLVATTSDIGNSGGLGSFEILSQARVSPNGRYLGFLMQGGVSGRFPMVAQAYDTAYLYDYGADELSCASCPPSGALTTGPTSLRHLRQFQPMPLKDQLHDSRNVTDNGQMFFQSASSLSKRDTNIAYDPYTFVDGRVHLLSSGRATTSSWFADASADGETAVIVTRDRLTDSDTDDLADMYALRVGGGEPAAPATAAPCSGEECRGASSSAPAVDVGSDGPTTGVREVVQGRVRVRTKQARGKAFWLKVRVSAPGLVKVSGRGVKTSRRELRGGNAKVRVRLKRGAVRKLARNGKLKLRLSVRFRPDEGRAAEAVATVRLRKAGRARATASTLGGLPR